MAEYDYDLFTIGAGSGGVRASRMSALHGAKTAVAEEHRPGGTCVIRGCVPKKFMVYASNYAKQFKSAKGYGWDVGEPAFDWPRFRDAMNAEVDRLSGIYAKNLANSGVDLIEERAELVDAHTIRLMKSDRTVTARHILIATGGTPYRPEELPGVEHCITSNEVFHLKSLPRHLVIAGGGYIACEFAQVFAGLGVQTCLVYRGDTVLRGFDEDVRTFVHEGLKASGVRVITHTVFKEITKGEDGRMATSWSPTKWCWPSDAIRTRRASAWMPQASRSMRRAPWSSTRTPAPMSSTSTRWATSPTGSI